MKKVGKISALQSILEDMAQPARREDEFTVGEFIEMARAMGSEIAFNTAYARLQREAKAGRLTSRKISINGSLQNLYKDAQ
jgi:hypothetical protein